MKATDLLNYFLINRYILFTLNFALLFGSCAYNHVPDNNEHIQLIWNNAPAIQTQEEFETGMAWLFSYLGAALPKSEFYKAVSFKGNIVQLQIEHLGFNQTAKDALVKLIILLKESEEYKQNEAVDAGRFFALCFNSSWHYYEITGVSKHLAEFKKRIPQSTYKQVAVDTSSVAKQGRLIKYATQTNQLDSCFFMANEGSGYFTSGNFVPSGTIETFDYMANGQPRFAIYGPDGNLQAATETTFSNAGKPSKCMWCHESKMQPLFQATPNITGYTSTAEFETDQKNFNSFLTTYHSSQNSFIIFKNLQDHAQGEYIYLNFFEPNAQRLSLEWGMTESKVKSILSGISTHTNPEFPFLQNVYYRNEVAPFSPFEVLQVCEKAREPNGTEPDYLK